MPRPTAPIHFLGGSNELTVKAEAQKLADTLVPAAEREFGLEIVNGQAANVEEALAILRRLREALDTLPFLGTRKVVWLKNTNLFGDNAVTKSAAIGDALSDLADSLKKGLPADVTLLVSATEVDKRRALYKTVEKAGDARLFERPADLDKGGREQVTNFVHDQLKTENRTIAPDALELLVELVGTDFRAYAQEITKLVLYIGDRTEITEGDVEAVVSASATVTIWKLMDALGARNAPAAMAALDNLLTQKESVIGIIALASWNMRQALLCRDLIDRRQLEVGGSVWDFKRSWERLPASETAHFPRTKTGAPPNPFGIHRCALTARNFTQKELIAAMQTLLEANRTVVSSGVDDRTVLEEALLKIIMRGKRRQSVEHQSVGA